METLERIFGLHGRVAVVTGGGGGIGRAVVELLAAAGAAVVVVDRDAEAAGGVVDRVAADGGRALAIASDLTDPAAVDRAVAGTVTAYGRLDLLVNNAGMVHRGPALDTALATWRQVMAVNLDAAFVCSCAAARAMTTGGAIVNLASIMGMSGGGAYPIAAYHASKGGLVTLTKALAVEWAPRGIRVNAVAPAWVKTEFTKALFEDERVAGSLRSLMPLGDFLEPADVAAAVLYLLSPAARCVTGHVLAVDGGYLAR